MWLAYAREAPFVVAKPAKTPRVRTQGSQPLFFATKFAKTPRTSRTRAQRKRRRSQVSARSLRFPQFRLSMRYRGSHARCPVFSPKSPQIETWEPDLRRPGKMAQAKPEKRERGSQGGFPGGRSPSRPFPPLRRLGLRSAAPGGYRTPVACSAATLPPSLPRRKTGGRVRV